MDPDAAADMAPFRLRSATDFHHYNEQECEQMERFDSVSSFETHHAVYKDHLEFRLTEPRWFVWVFVVFIGLMAGVTAILFTSVLHVAIAGRHRLILWGLQRFAWRVDSNITLSNGLPYTTSTVAFAERLRGGSEQWHGIPSPSVGGGYAMWIVCVVFFGLIAAAINAWVPGSRGGGYVEVTSFLNGVANPAMSDPVSFLAKFTASLATVASGAPAGYYGTLMQLGSMTASLCTARNRWITFPHISIVRHFRNPRDERVLLLLGSAAGVAAAFGVTIGGLMFIMEHLVTAMTVRFHLYSFCACLIAALTLQVYYSYMGFFELRQRPPIPGTQLLTDVLVQFDSGIGPDEPIRMNVLDFVPSIAIGLLCGLLSAAFAKLSMWTLSVRRRWEEKLRYPRMKYLMPIGVTVAYVTVAYWLPLLLFFTEVTENPSFDTLSCVLAPPQLGLIRNESVIGLYGTTGHFCDPLTKENATTGELTQPAVLHPFMSLAFGPGESALQLLLSQYTPHITSGAMLMVFIPLYLIFAAVTSGMCITSDYLLPGMVVGAATGRLVGVVTNLIANSVSTNNQAWADPGVFAAMGMAAFLACATGMTFSVGVIAMELNNDNRHLLCIMVSISVAKMVSERFTRNLTSLFHEARCVPILNFLQAVHKYDMFSARHVMAKNVVSLKSIMEVAHVAEVLRTTRHNAFPVVAVEDGTLKGIVMRDDLTLVLYHVCWTRTTSQPCTLENMRVLRDQLVKQRLQRLPVIPRKLQTALIDLNPYIDTSTFCVKDSTSVSRLYRMCLTLGIRHLIVLDRGNAVVGMITRKDIVTSSLLSRIQEENRRRQRCKEERVPSPPGGTQAPSPVHSATLSAKQIAGDLIVDANEDAETATTTATGDVWVHVFSSERHDAETNTSVALTGPQAMMSQRTLRRAGMLLGIANPSDIGPNPATSFDQVHHQTSVRDSIQSSDESTSP